MASSESSIAVSLFRSRKRAMLSRQARFHITARLLTAAWCRAIRQLSANWYQSVQTKMSRGPIDRAGDQTITESWDRLINSFEPAEVSVRWIAPAVAVRFDEQQEQSAALVVSSSSSNQVRWAATVLSAHSWFSPAARHRLVLIGRTKKLGHINYLYLYLYLYLY